MDIKNKLGAGAVAFGLVHVACSAGEQAPWREQMQCGDTQYVIESTANRTTTLPR